MNDRVFTARLVAASPLHPGSGDGGLATDLPVLRDSSGHVYLPGTQLGGRLRETATRLGPALGWKACSALTSDRGPCGCPVCRTFGERGFDEEDGPGAGAASAVWCFDAPAEERCPGPSLVRDGVGISRQTGASAAEAGALYDREWIPAGTAFRIRVEVDHRAVQASEVLDEISAHVEVEDVLAVALSEWVEGRGRIGAGSARGGGAFRLEGEGFRRADLSSGPKLMEFLRQTDPALRGRPEADWLEQRLEKVRPPSPRPRDDFDRRAVGHFAEIRFDLAFQGAVLVSDPAAALANGLSFAPVFAGAAWTKPVLPGSSLRGVLRAQVERIARTLASRAAAAVPPGERARALALACPACDPFRGLTKEDKTFPALASCAAVRRVRDQEDGEPPADCMGCALFGSTHQGSRLWLADAELAGDPAYLLRDFVAIDRFTGGALEGAKFDALPLWSPTFRVSLLLWDAAPWELAALAFALRDLHDGLATVGAHGSRGFGRAEVAGEVGLTVGSAAAGAPLEPAVGEPEWSGVFRLARWTGDPAALVGLARSEGWARDFRDQCEGERRSFLGEDKPVADGYFGVDVGGGLRLEDLYPLAVTLAGKEAGDVGGD